MKTAFKKEAKEKLIKGMSEVEKAVGSTLGPYGRNVIFSDENGNIRSTKDGVTVAKMITEIEDPMENMGAQLIKQASIKTAEKAGDGTTTSTILAYKLANDALLSIDDKTNVTQLKRGIDKAYQDVIKYLEDIKLEISGVEQIKNIATISANGDEYIGKLVSHAVDTVGRDGIVTVEESKSNETYLESVEGIQFDRGYKSMYFVTDNNTMTANLKDPKVLLYQGRLVNIKEMISLLEYISVNNHPLLIIADDIDGEALATLIVNKQRGIFNVVAVKAPDYGDRRTAIMEDIATVTGGHLISPEKGDKLDKFNPEWLGQARSATIDKDSTTIVDGKGTAESIAERIDSIKDQISNSKSSFEKEHLQERLGRLVGGVAIINVGGITEIEMKEKKDRIDDALQATRAAIESGILPGGGVPLYRASCKCVLEDTENVSEDFVKGYNILREVCTYPYIKILENSGINPDKDVLLKGQGWEGYYINEMTNKVEYEKDMLERGIIDPMKVVKTALETAVSVAGTVLLTECVIYNKEDKKQEENIYGQ